jgi:poly-gamma-glutamate capsule biosynthesis protein CapA/YwtB (metallophosphatase superfamily)
MIHIRTSRQLWLFRALFLLLVSTGYSQNDQQLSFIFVGDVMQHGGQIAGAYNKMTGGYDYDEGFKFVKPLIEEKDLAICNLEVTHAGLPYKGYPQFSAPDELSSALVDAGFDVILTANNHSCDGGVKGVIRTLDVLDKLGVKHTGTFRSQAEREANYPLILDKNGIKVAILNYTYGTNGLKVAAPLIINYIDSAVLKIDILKAKKLNADYIICTMHWGAEYQSFPNNYQKQFENYCYELGADMIIGGHPHVLQPVEKKLVNKKEKLTVWSLGNFVSNQRDRFKNGGVMVTANIFKPAIQNLNNSTLPIHQVRLNDVEYIFTYVHVRSEGVLKPFYILPEFDYNSIRPDFMGVDDQHLMQEFFTDSRKLFSEHSKGVKERRVVPQSAIADLYTSYLSGYYSVLVQKTNKTSPPSVLNSFISSYIHKIVYPDGEYGYVSGICSSLDQAKGQKLFLEDCKLGGALKIVYVSPKEIKIVEE